MKLLHPARAADADEPLYIVTYVDVMPTARVAGLTAMRAYRSAVAAERGNRVVTALQETSRPGPFVIMETWDTKAEFEAHLTGAALRLFTALD